jgi:MerR family transcriptional regulator, copper efflux regulator
VAGSSSDGGALVPIDQLARQFGIRASALRYYEERGLLSPASFHSGRRWYGPEEVRRVAVIRYWQESGLMTLDEIAELVAGPGTNRPWGQVLEDRVEALRAQIEKMRRAKSFLEHVVAHHDSAPDGCPYYETLLWGTGADHEHIALEGHGSRGYVHEED